MNINLLIRYVRNTRALLLPRFPNLGTLLIYFLNLHTVCISLWHKLIGRAIISIVRYMFPKQVYQSAQ